jgi:hypothetical protein
MSRRKQGGSPFSLFSFQDIITCVSGIIILITLVLAIELSQRKKGSPAAQTAKLAADIRSAIEDTRVEIKRLEAELARQSSAAQEAAGAHTELLQSDLMAANQQIKSLEAELAEIQRKEKLASAEHERVQAKQFDQQKELQKTVEVEQEVKNLEDKLEELIKQDRPIYNSRTADGKQVWLVQVDGVQSLVAPAGKAGKPVALAHGSSLLSDSEFERWLGSKSSSADFVFFLVRPEGAKEFSTLKEEASSRGFSLGFDLLGETRVAIDPVSGAAGL